MKLLIVVILALTLLQLINAEIYCNDRGECAGSGGPAEDTRCGGCHSCSFKGCCHVRFTNPYTKCEIDGACSAEYKAIHG